MARLTPESEATDDILYDIGKACEEHLETCLDAEFINLDESGESPAFMPFCGCTTCTVREVLMVAFPLFQEHFGGKSD